MEYMRFLYMQLFVYSSEYALRKRGIGIPYRTVTDWELGNRKLPDYVLRMMTYQVKMEKLDALSEGRTKDKGENAHGERISII